MQNSVSAIVAIFVLSSAPFQLPAQEPFTAAESATEAKSADTKPSPIPLSLLFQLPSSGATFAELELTQEQKKFITGHIKHLDLEISPLQIIQSDLENTRLTNHRFLIAIYESLHAAEVHRRDAVQQILAAGQQSKLRQLRRAEISIVNARDTKPPLKLQAGTALGDYLAADDLLSVLILPDVQQSLLISDEQLEMIDREREEAYPAARELIAKAIQTLAPVRPVPDPRIQNCINQLLKDWHAILTSDQQKRFESFLKERQGKPRTPTEHSDFTDAGNSVVDGEQTIFIRYTLNDGVNIHHLSIPLLYAETGVQRALELTPEQRTKFVKLHATAQASINQFSQEALDKLALITNWRQHELRELVLAHNRQYHSRLTDVLTQEQHELLEQNKWRGLGLGALQRPQVAEELKLSAAQQTAINAIFATPPPPYRISADPTDSIQVQKVAAEFQRRQAHHQSLIATRIWSQLTPEQAGRLAVMIGVNRPEETNDGERSAE